MNSRERAPGEEAGVFSFLQVETNPTLSYRGEKAGCVLLGCSDDFSVYVAAIEARYSENGDLPVAKPNSRVYPRNQ